MQAFIARQPVFDRHDKVYGYELLYRSGWVECCDHSRKHVASLKVIADTLNLIGLDSLTTGKPAFFNVTREVLLSQTCDLLPAGLAIVEILETVEPDEAVAAACRDLKDAGFNLILQELPLSEDVSAALLGNENRLRRVRDFAMACERADWETMAKEASALGIDEQRSWQLYLEALTWARETCGEGLLPA